MRVQSRTTDIREEKKTQSKIKTLFNELNLNVHVN